MNLIRLNYKLFHDNAKMSKEELIKCISALAENNGETIKKILGLRFGEKKFCFTEYTLPCGSYTVFILIKGGHYIKVTIDKDFSKSMINLRARQILAFCNAFTEDFFDSDKTLPKGAVGDIFKSLLGDKLFERVKMDHVNLFAKQNDYFMMYFNVQDRKAFRRIAHVLKSVDRI